MRASGKATSLSRMVNNLTKKLTTFSTDLLSVIPRADLAAEMAGTSDKRTRAYKTARDVLSRYQRGGRKASKSQRDKIEAAARRVIADNPSLLSVTVPSGEIIVSGLLCYSAECRDRTIHVQMSVEQMAALFESKDPDLPLNVYLEGMYYGPRGNATRDHSIVIELDE